MKSEPSIEQLAAFGISSTEARIYLHLINKSPKSILDIAQELGLPRTSVYDNAIKLAEKGLVQKIVKFKSQKLQAYPLSNLQTYIDKEKARVEELQEKLTTLEQNLTKAATSPHETEVRYYHGIKGIQQMIWNNLKANQEIIGYSEFGLIKVVGKTFAQKHASELMRRNVRNRILTNPEYVSIYKLDSGPITTYRENLQQCRVLASDQLYISGDTMIYDNIFAAIYWQQGEYVGVEIENAEMVKTQKSIFELLWTQGTPIAKK